MEYSCENSPNGSKFLHSEIQVGADQLDLRGLRDLNPRELDLSHYEAELAPQ